MQQFEELPIAKQKRILNAGMEVFGKHEYKHANTEDIARLAGISKGLLFYYFKNKQSFYLYIFDYCETLVKEFITVEEYGQIDDFFELMSFGANRKLELMNQYPYCMDFIMKAWFAFQAGEIELLNGRIQNIVSSTYSTWFTKIDTSRFKDGVEPIRIYQMMTWMMEGYLSEHRLSKQPIDMKVMMEEFYQWMEMFKRLTYKEEYL